MKGWLSVVASGFLLALWVFPQAAADEGGASASPQIRTYYIAVDEVAWDYAPSDTNQITGRPFTDEENTWIKSGPERIGKVCLKALYREYTDSTFATLKPVPPERQHLGLLGPLLRAEVGDTLQVVFKNNARFPFSVHPHGVFYAKESEGAPYNDGTSGANKGDDAVPPGGTHTYTWQVPERAGPGPRDGTSVVWIYHSHTDEVRDTNAGLVGAIIVTARGMARADGSPLDVDREFVNLFAIFDENSSHYLGQNIQTYAGEPKEVERDEPEFMESNLKHGINGYLYGNMPPMTTRKGERVRWYLLGLGTEVDLHTPHWHAQSVLWMGMRTDMVELLPGSMRVVDMIPDNPGTWLYHCHVNDHITAGMVATFTVLP
jgi:manganese oxidase